MHDAVDWCELGGMQIMAQNFRLFGDDAAAGDVELTVLRSNLGNELQFGCVDRFRPFGEEDFHVGDRIAVNARLAEITLPGVADRALPVRILVLRQR